MRFTIRDLLWLMVVVGMGVGWWMDRRSTKAELELAVTAVAEQWSREVGHPVSFTVPGEDGRREVVVVVD